MLIKNNKLYDVLKWTAQIFLPALAALYFGLANIWGLPYAPQVVGTITTFNAFLGVLLGISTANYNSNKVKDELDIYKELLNLELQKMEDTRKTEIEEEIEDIKNR